MEVMYADTVLMPALAARGLTVVDLRRRLPHNTTYPRARAWDRRPLEAISIVAVHYDAIPLRPIGRYDPVARYVAEARDHIAKDWGNGWHAPTIAYLLKIDGQPDEDLATVYVLNDVEEATWNANDANGIDVAVCVDLGQGQEPFRSQLATLQRVLDVFDQDTPELPCSHSETYGHGELTAFGNATSCPGALRPYVQRYRETGALYDGAADYQEEDEMAKLSEDQRAILDKMAGLNANSGSIDSWVSTIGAYEKEIVPRLQGRISELENLVSAQVPIPSRVEVIQTNGRRDGFVPET
jgi:hypothetical protein